MYAIAQGINPNQIFTGGGDRIVALWDGRSGNQLPFSVRTEAPIYSLFFFESAQLLFMGCSNGKLHVVDVQSKKETHAWSLDGNGIFDLKLDAARGRLLAAGGSGVLTVLDLSSMEVIRSIPLSDGKLRRLAINKDCSLLAVADSSGPVHILDAESYHTTHILNAHAEGATAVAWHPSKPVIISGGKDAFIRCHSSLDNFKQVLSLAAHQSTIYDVVYHAATQQFVSCSRDKTIKWWDSATFDPQRRVGFAAAGHKHSVNRLLSSGLHIVSASDDYRVLVFGA